MPQMADIHNHALFSVDDGAVDLDMSLKMLAASYADGVRDICLTPHYDTEYMPPPEKLRAHFEMLCERAREELPALSLYLGAELYVTADTVDLLKNGSALPFNGTRYVLVEFSPTVPYEKINSSLHALQMAGYAPILAHAERYSVLVHYPHLVWDLHEMRVLIQVNASSVAGHTGFRIRRFIRCLLREKMIHAVASDAHDMHRRPPMLSTAYAKVVKLCGGDYAQKIFYANPMRYISEKKGALL